MNDYRSEILSALNERINSINYCFSIGLDLIKSHVDDKIDDDSIIIKKGFQIKEKLDKDIININQKSTDYFKKSVEILKSINTFPVNEIEDDGIRGMLFDYSQIYSGDGNGVNMAEYNNLIKSWISIKKQSNILKSVKDRIIDQDEYKFSKNLVNKLGL
jgi:hypothetical protein